MTASVPSRSLDVPPPLGVASVPVRVVVVDDHEMLRDTIRNLLLGVEDMEWVGGAANGADAMDIVDATRPDVVLMDLSMPGMDGFSATRCIVASHPFARVLVLTSSTDPNHEALSLAAGAAGVLTKDGDPATILSGIRAVMRGDLPGPARDESG